MKYTLVQGRIKHPIVRARIALYRLLARSSTALASLAILIAPLMAFVAPVHASNIYRASDVLGHTDSNGNPDFTKGNNSDLRYPFGAIIDSVHHRMFVADSYTCRILVYDLDNADKLIDHTVDYILGQPNLSSAACATTQSKLTINFGMTFNSSTSQLFVADTYNNRVLVYSLAGGISTGMNASFVIGQPDFTSASGQTTQSGMNNPYAVAINQSTDQLFVADANNSRVLIFELAGGITNGMNASHVLGQADFTSNGGATTQSGMNNPTSVTLDTSANQLFVTAANNERVVVYDLSGGITDGMNASHVLGQPDFTSSGQATSQSGMNNPYSSSYDPTTHQLFVSEIVNNRVLVYDLSGGITDGMNASHVLGQPDFTSSSSGGSLTGMFYPQGVSFTPGTNQLLVADYLNHRVLVFDISSGVTNDMPASDVVGPRADKIDYSQGTTLDPVHHRLFVASCGYRVMVYNLDGNNNLIDHGVDYELGQIDFTSQDTTNSQSTIGCAEGPLYDATTDRLFVGDDGSQGNRILVFDLSGGITNGMPASYVIGQPDFTSSAQGTTAAALNDPYGGMAYDPGTKYLYFSDSRNGRVLVYDLSVGITNGMNASYVIGQPDFTTQGNYNDPPTRSNLGFPYGLALDTGHHRLFVADDGYAGRVMVYDTSSLSNGMDASNVLGPPDFTTSGQPVDRNAPTPTSMDPEMLSYDPIHQKLFVGDDADARVLVFDLSSGIIDGMAATGVLGVPDFTTNGYPASGCSPASQTSLCDTEGLSDYYDTDHNRLYVSDSSNNRVMIYEFVKLNAVAAGQVGVSYSQTLGSQSQGTTLYTKTAGTLPAGMSINAATGVLSGTPTTAGTYNFTINVVDDNGIIGSYSDTKDYVFSVTGAAPTSSVENAGPNGGDANGDGTPDSQQANVTSMVNPITGTYTVLQTSACPTINDLSVTSEASNDTQDAAFSYPLGLQNFTVSGCTTGSTTTIVQYFYSALDPTLLLPRKYDSVAKSYTTIPGATVSRVTIGGKTAIKVVYTITDGGPLDQDGQANGVIVDPSGPAVNAAGVPNTGLGGSR